MTEVIHLSTRSGLKSRLRRARNARILFRQKKDFLAVVAFLFLLSLFIHPTTTSQAQKTLLVAANYAHLVDPWTGTATQHGFYFGGGNTFPGASIPFGMVQWSPDTLSNPPGGYAFKDTSLKGFSLTHLSGSGCRVYQDLPFMPYNGVLTTSPARNPSLYNASFSHADETAYAGYYSVKLHNGTHVELSATQRTGVARFTYPAGQPATLLISIAGSVNGVSQAQAKINGNTITGIVSSGAFCHKTAHYTLYFYATFSQPFSGYGAWQDGKLLAQKALASGNHSGLYVTFPPGSPTVITARVGLSYVSTANAQANLVAENSTGDFETVRAQAVHTWDTFLGEIQISGGTPAQVSTFYTTLYHALLHPNVFSDVNGQYIGFDHKVHSVRPDHAQYANFSGWDIYRSEAQLLAFLTPNQASDMAQSLINDYLQSGTLPRWSLANWETLDMVGDPGTTIIADMYAFGATDFDTSTALAAMIHQATKPNQVRSGLAYQLGRGYLPLDPNLHLVGAAALSLEYDTSDFALAAFARTLGDTSTYQRFLTSAQNWKNLLNARDGYLEPRYLNGTFRSPYSLTSTIGWIEGDGAQYTWMVPFDLNGLFQALGGNRQVIARLNRFFTHLNGYITSPYAFLGNEPSLEVPWEYDYAGAPYLTQKIVREAENTLFATGPGGLPGNDDLGEISSWYVWAALGMFPETPGTANLVLSSPLFPLITIKRPDAPLITISAPAASASIFAVQSLQVNGVTSNNPWLPPWFITSGGTLNYTLAASVNTSWGTDPANAPPSYEPPARGMPIRRGLQ